MNASKQEKNTLNLSKKSQISILKEKNKALRFLNFLEQVEVDTFLMKITNFENNGSKCELFYSA